MDYLTAPLHSLPRVVLEKLDFTLNKSINRIDNFPVRFDVYEGGIVVYMTKAYAFRSDCITQIRGKSIMECLNQLKLIRINEAGVLDNETYKLESAMYDAIQQQLGNASHIDIVDRKCAVCYNYTPHTADQHQHPLCNRCILRVTKCPICRQDILMESELEEDDDENLTVD